MEDLLNWAGGVFDTIFNFFEIIIDCLTLIVDFFSMAGDAIAMCLQFPVHALEAIYNFAAYFPNFIWIPIAALLYMVFLFRVLSIILSGGN